MKLTGLIAATYTPFHDDGSLNLEPIAAMTDLMIDRGVAGFYVCGSTGEGESLSVEERKQVAESFVAATDQRVPVVIQVGHNSLESATDLALHAASTGADAISSLPTTYFKAGLARSVGREHRQGGGGGAELPYYYYHIPRLAGVTFDTVDLLVAVAERIPNFAGIKFSDFFLAEMMACMEVDDERFDILFGSDEMLLGALATGARGAVGSCYGFAAPLWLNIIETYESGDMEKARAWMRKAARLVRFIATDPGPFQGVGEAGHLAVARHRCWCPALATAGPGSGADRSGATLAR